MGRSAGYPDKPPACQLNRQPAVRHSLHWVFRAFEASRNAIGLHA
jgi:hypothetical protein